MEQIGAGLKNYLGNKIEQAKGKPKQTREQSLADEIWNFFGKPKRGEPMSFPMIMGFIRNRTFYYVNDTFREIVKSDCENPMTLFLSKMRKPKDE